MAQRRDAQGRAGTWPEPSGVAAPWLRPLPGLAGPWAATLRGWAAAEVAPGRLMPWLRMHPSPQFAVIRFNR
jgi:hypothetical protein